ncbi:MAG: hypothetical protein EZS28_006458 [Streblomastix strix]|uniref:Uncharacterized protein n=1 Tax=Streblomastix strix TaxID=222440 RepID=A0A5J4WSU9_9EUKA|nr:MAG: hypothetical protein EZS28_006458 [Streblomastix strix]
MKNKELINEQQFMRQQVEIFGTAGGIGEENMEDVLDSLHNVSCILNGYKEIKDADDSYVESKKRCLEQSIEEGGIEEIESYIKHKYISYRYYYTVKISYNVKKAIVNNWNDPTNNQ